MSGWMLAFVITMVAIPIGVPAVVLLLDPPSDVKSARDERKASRMYRKGMVLRRTGDDPFSESYYRYVSEVKSNNDGVAYVKSIPCGENGDFPEDAAGSAWIGTAGEYMHRGWAVYKDFRDTVV